MEQIGVVDASGPSILTVCSTPMDSSTSVEACRRYSVSICIKLKEVTYVAINEIAYTGKPQVYKVRALRILRLTFAEDEVCRNEVKIIS